MASNLVDGFPTAQSVIHVMAPHPGILFDVDDAHVLDIMPMDTTFEVKTGIVGRLNVWRNFVQHHGTFRAIMPEGLFEMHWPGVDESRFVGGHTDVALDTDPGLWCMGAAIDIDGAVITPMAIAVVDLLPTHTEILLDRDPIGWQAGAKLAIAPMLPHTAPNWTDAYDYPIIKSITGRLVSLEQPLVLEHRRCGPFRDGTYEGAEVLYLGKRSVRFTGLPGKRPHIMVMAHDATAPIPIRARYFETQYLGPQKLIEGNQVGIEGRWAGLHLHKMGDFSRGALIEGALFQDAGGHCAVPHASHGTTWRDTWAHNVDSGAPWWFDRQFGGAGGAEQLWANMTHDTLWERCGGSRVRYTPASRAQQLTIFSFNGGLRNVSLDCRAFGLIPGRLTSGGLWAEGESGNPLGDTDFTQQSGVWKVIGMRVHSCWNGWKEWQNTSNDHGGVDGEDLQARIYLCKIANNRGAYGNIYKSQLEILACQSVLEIHAQARERNGGMIMHVYADGQGLMTYGVEGAPHARLPSIPLLFPDPVFKNLTADGACFHLKKTDSERVVIELTPADLEVEPPLAPGSFFPDDWLATNPDFGGNREAQVDADAHQDSKIEFRLSDGQTLRVMRTLVPGVLNPGDDYLEPLWGEASVKIL